MNRLGDVAKQLANGIGRKPGRRLQPISGCGRRLAVGTVAETLLQNAELDLRQLDLQAIELFVQQAYLLTVRDQERLEAGSRCCDFGAACAEQAVELNHP